MSSNTSFEEVKVLREHLSKKPRFNDDQRRRLAAKAQKLGRDRLRRFASIVSPRTLLDWHRHLISRKYDGSSRRSPGRPPTPAALGLVRYHVLFVMRLATREVHITGIIPEAHGRWMKQVARNLTDRLDGFWPAVGI